MRSSFVLTPSSRQEIVQKCPTPGSACPNKKELAELLQCALIFDGTDRPKGDIASITSFLQAHKYKGLYARNQIHLEVQTREWWQALRGVKKIDISDVGNREGTGIVDFGGWMTVDDELSPRLAAFLEKQRQQKPAADATPEPNNVPCQGFIKNSSFMLYETEFYPAVTSKESGLDKEMAQVQRDLRALNDKTMCSKGAKGYTWHTYGLGACLHLLIHPFTQAVEAGKAFGLTGHMISGRQHTKSTFCPQGDVYCFLQPTTQCTNIPYGRSNPFKRNFVPSKYSKLDRGSFWWVSQLMSYIFNITPDLRELVEKTKKEIGFRGPIMAMQIRHGDSCVVRPDCKGLGEYMKHARVMKAKYGVKRIFLATDSYKIITQTRFYPDFEFVYQDFDRRSFEIPRALKTMVIDECHQTGQCDAVEDIKTMMIGI
jgi:hypothetical protein